MWIGSYFQQPVDEVKFQMDFVFIILQMCLRDFSRVAGGDSECAGNV
jgi:hypothetical protein